MATRGGEPDPSESDIVGGDEFGAIRLRSLDKLLGAQKRAAQSILRGIHGVALAAHERPDGRAPVRPDRGQPEPLDDTLYFQRPHHSFVIDGERGSGKTTVLLTLYGYIKAMRLDTGRCEPPSEPDDHTKRDLEDLRLRPPSRDGNRRTGLLLPIVFPETIEEGETTMEAVFAHMDLAIERELDAEPREGGRRSRLTGLQDSLRLQVGKAWTFSHRIGERALANDALDYTDFVLRRAEHNRLSYARINLWRRFVDAFLDEMNCALLVLAFDDSDLDPGAAEEIVRSVRIYCSHPRIVTLMAVDLPTLRDSLLVGSLAKRTPGLQTLDYLRANRLAVEEQAKVGALVDKVLPAPLRSRLDTAAEQLDVFFRPDFTTFARIRFERLIEEGDERQALAWWLLAHPYRPLLHDTTRRLVSFRSSVTAPGHVDVVEDVMAYAKLDSVRRLVGPRFADLGRAVSAGNLSASTEEIAAELVIGDFERLAVDFGVDLDIARRHLSVAGQGWIAGWLLDEPDEDRPRRFGRPDERLGLSSVLPVHAAPRNCLYVHQYRTLQRRRAERPSEASEWLGHLRGLAAGELQPAEALAASIREWQEILGFDDEHALDSLDTGMRRFRRPSRGSPLDGPLHRRSSSTLDGADVEVLVIVLQLVARGRGGSRAELRQGLGQAVATKGGEAKARAQFAGALLRAFAPLEADARGATATWLDALDVVGEDGTATPGERGGSHPETSFAELVARTEAAMRTGVRPSILLAWAVLPALHPLREHLHDPGGSHWDVSASWNTIQHLFDHVIGMGFADAAIHGWDAPDLDDRTREIIERVTREEWTFLQLQLEAGAPAASARPGAWPGRPEDLFALLLGTTADWASRFIAIHH